MLLPLLIGSALGVGFLLSEGHFAQIGVFFCTVCDYGAQSLYLPLLSRCEGLGIVPLACSTTASHAMNPSSVSYLRLFESLRRTAVVAHSPPIAAKSRQDSAPALLICRRKGARASEGGSYANDNKALASGVDGRRCAWLAGRRARGGIRAVAPVAGRAGRARERGARRIRRRNRRGRYPRQPER